MKYAPTFSDHLTRYVYAQRFAWKKNTFDAGSKEGFGSQILSHVAKSVTLSDIDERFLAFAKKTGGFYCPVSFVQSDFNKGFPEGTWETIVAFEVIEHVENPDFFVANIARALTEDGTLVFSVPHMVANHEHKTLFDEKKIRALINNNLTIVEFHVQNEKPISKQPLHKGLTCYVGVAKKKTI